jgi:hypothetical protein
MAVQFCGCPDSTLNWSSVREEPWGSGVFAAEEALFGTGEPRVGAKGGCLECDGRREPVAAPGRSGKDGLAAIIGYNGLTKGGNTQVDDNG